MTTNDLLKIFCPQTLAQLAAELIANHATPNGRGLDFDTETSAHAFTQIVAAGCSLVRSEFFFDLIDEAQAALAN